MSDEKENQDEAPKHLVFQAPAILTSISHTADGGLRLGFTTNELSDHDKMIATKFHRKFGYAMFKANKFSSADVPKGDAPEGITHSQRLRKILYKLYMETGGEEKHGDWEVYYRNKMEVFIDTVGKKLDSLIIDD